MYYRSLVACLGLAGFTGASLPAGETPAQAIDRLVAAAWARDKVQPTRPADDPEFVRRIYLDLVGRIPTTEESLAFCRDKSSNKRSALIDALLAGGEFPKHWRENLHLLLMGGRPFAGDPEWRQWLEESLRQNKGWDAMVREILAARSEPPQERAAGHFLISRLAQGDTGLDLVTRDVSRLFFGVDIQCARCHKHPDVSQWKQDSYWGMVAFFNRSYPLVVKGKTYVAERANGEVEYTPKGKDKKTVLPTFLNGEKLAEPQTTRVASVPAGKTSPSENAAEYLVAPEEAKEKTRIPVPKYSRRAKLVEAAIGPNNRFFKRAAVNYIWSQLMGRGLVEPVDQMHDANPASHPELLDFLADDFAAHQFDLRHLIRGIANSSVYQLSSRYVGSTPPAEATYARAIVRPLSAQQTANSLLVAAGFLDALKNKADPKLRTQAGALRSQMETQHAARLTFLVQNLTGGSEAATAGIAEALFQANNKEFADLLAAGGRAARLAAAKDDSALVQELFMGVLSRPPTAEEQGRARSYLQCRVDRRRAACEQLLWALTASSEFRFNH